MRGRIGRCTGGKEASPIRAVAGRRRVFVSVMEVYNECIYDLVAVAASGAKVGLKLKEDRGGRVYVRDLGEVEVGSVEEALEVQRRAARVRQSAGEWLEQPGLCCRMEKNASMRCFNTAYSTNQRECMQ